MADSGVDLTDAGDAGGGVPIDNLSADQLVEFSADRTAFYQKFAAVDGLGPLYTETSCGDCHMNASRGPGAATKMVVVEGDGLTALGDQSLLPFGNTEHPKVVTEIPGASTPILPPFTGVVDGGADAGSISIRITRRLGPSIVGRGYLDAVADSEIERMESQQATRTDGIHGRVNHVTFISQANPDATFDSHQPGDSVIGRFGMKARIATLDEFTADALQGDMGITSPMRPTEFKNPDGIADDLKAGVDVTADAMNARAAFVRLLAIPPRSQKAQNGQAWFGTCHCDVCHAETLRTRSDYPVPQLANIDAPIYTDMLIHDMGDNLADSVGGGNEGQAGPRDWRTPPLIGLRESVTYLHDGRSTTIADAIAQHGGPGSEAADSAACYSQLAPNIQQQLLDFLADL